LLGAARSSLVHHCSGEMGYVKRPRFVVAVVFSLFLTSFVVSQLAKWDGAHQVERVLLSMSVCFFGIAGVLLAPSRAKSGQIVIKSLPSVVCWPLPRRPHLLMTWFWTRDVSIFERGAGVASSSPVSCL
jgi:hypothetical protein